VVRQSADDQDGTARFGEQMIAGAGYVVMRLCRRCSGVVAVKVLQPAWRCMLAGMSARARFRRDGADPAYGAATLA